MNSLCRLWTGLFFCLLLSAVLWPAIFAQGAAELAGTWDMNVSAPAGERQVVVTFKKEGEAWSGALRHSRGELPFQSVSLKGEDMEIVLKMPIEGQEQTFHFKGKIQGTSMKGEADLASYGNGNWTATRRAEAPAQSAGSSGLTGPWKFEFDTPNGLQTADFQLAQEGEKLTGTAKSNMGETQITGSVKEKKIELSFQVVYQGEPMKIKCSGDIENPERMTGSFTYNDMGPGSWSAKKGSGN